MKIIDRLELYPGAPGLEMSGDGVVAAKLLTSAAPRNPDGTRKRGRMTLDGLVMFEDIVGNYGNEMHLIAMMRATPEGWSNGMYRGHGGIIGPVLDGQIRGALESWSPRYSNWAPGGHFIPPLSASAVAPQGVVYRWRVTSLFDAPGYKYFGYALWEPNKPPIINTGDVEDDNADVNMDSDAMVIVAHMPRIPGRTGGKIVLGNVHLTHTDDCTPLGDLRGLWVR